MNVRRTPSWTVVLQPWGPRTKRANLYSPWYGCAKSASVCARGRGVVWGRVFFDGMKRTRGRPGMVETYMRKYTGSESSLQRAYGHKRRTKGKLKRWVCSSLAYKSYIWRTSTAHRVFRQIVLEILRVRIWILVKPDKNNVSNNQHGAQRKPKKNEGNRSRRRRWSLSLESAVSWDSAHPSLLPDPSRST